MEAHDDGGRSAMRAIAVAAIALAGFVFALTPVAERLDASLLDLQWRVLRRFDARPVPDDIAIIGIDEATVRAIPEPPGLWHATLGRALAKLAGTKPRAIVLEMPLPDRSYDSVKPGLDRALFDGLATAIEGGPFVAVLGIDARTRSARTIHTPFLALLGESRLGLNLMARDADGVTRRFSLMVPTEDGGFPTLEGRLCRQLKRDCTDGFIHYGLGRQFPYVPLQNFLSMDEALARALFRDRIVLIGEAQAFAGRIEVPVNLSAWETDGPTSSSVVVHAQQLRTAFSGLAPQQASRPLVLVLLTLAALAFLVRDARMAALTAALVGIVAVVGAVWLLRSGTFLPVVPILATLALAAAARIAVAWRMRRSS